MPVSDWLLGIVIGAPLPPIYRDIQRLLVLRKLVRRFARYHKYTVGTDWRTQAMRMMRGVNRACFDTGQQAQHVQALVWLVDDYKLTLQLAMGMGAFKTPSRAKRISSSLKRLPIWWAGVVSHRHCCVKLKILIVTIGRNRMKSTLAVCAVLMVIVTTGTQAQPFTVSVDGQEVTDSRTNLIWRRCAEGLVASGGACTGSASAFTHEAALQRAADQAGSTGKAWRLPNVKELSSIADKSRSPAIDPAAFPATPSAYLDYYYFWSTSPYVGVSNSGVAGVGDAWFVNFFNGGVFHSYRGHSYSVRLVRDGQ